MSTARVLSGRHHLWAFFASCMAVTIGVLLHLPMFWMGRHDGFRLADVPMDAEMYAGMALILAGRAVAGYGLVPRKATGASGLPGGYLAAGGFAAWLEPIFSWRVRWFLNLPTGLLLIFLISFIPESPRFLLSHGRLAELRDTLKGFGCIVSAAQPDDAALPRPCGPTSRWRPCHDARRQRCRDRPSH